MGDGRYWSIEVCGWVASTTGDPLATPWSAHEVPLPASRPTPRDGWDLLRARPRSGPLPSQRGEESAAEPAVKAARVPTER
jgi:hypothetical protein